MLPVVQPRRLRPDRAAWYRASPVAQSSLMASARPRLPARRLPCLPTRPGVVASPHRRAGRRRAPRRAPCNKTVWCGGGRKPDSLTLLVSGPCARLSSHQLVVVGSCGAVTCRRVASRWHHARRRCAVLPWRREPRGASQQLRACAADKVVALSVRAICVVDV